MIGRASKKIFKNYLTDYLIKKKNSVELIPEFVIDFLNLIFGCGVQTDIFWSELLRFQIIYDFNYDIKELLQVLL